MKEPPAALLPHLLTIEEASSVAQAKRVSPLQSARQIAASDLCPTETSTVEPEQVLTVVETI